MLLRVELQTYWAQIMRDTCEGLASLPCVFIVALGRTGSTHVLHLLNQIDGYRISGETDNAWVYLGWWREHLGLTPTAQASVQRRLQDDLQATTWMVPRDKKGRGRSKPARRTVSKKGGVSRRAPLQRLDLRNRTTPSSTAGLCRHPTPSVAFSILALPPSLWPLALYTV